MRERGGRYSFNQNYSGTGITISLRLVGGVVYRNDERRKVANCSSFEARHYSADFFAAVTEFPDTGTMVRELWSRNTRTSDSLLPKF